MKLGRLQLRLTESAVTVADSATGASGGRTRITRYVVTAPSGAVTSTSTVRSLFNSKVSGADGDPPAVTTPATFTVAPTSAGVAVTVTELAANPTEPMYPNDATS